MKKVFLFCLVSLAAICLGADIVSTDGGGSWTNPGSWVGGVVPGSNDNVVINSTIYVNADAYCQNLTITASGSLQNQVYEVHSIWIIGNLSNAGSIVNHGYGGLLYCHFGGNINNSGTIAPNQIQLDGAADQYLSNTGNIANVSITDTNPASALILLSDLTVSNVPINLNGASFILDNAGGAYDLTMSGGMLQNVILQGGAGSILTMNAGCYIEYTAIDEITVAGTAVIGTGVSVGTLINYGTVYNYGYAVCALAVGQRLENRGTITNHPYGGILNVNLSGDLYDYGSISNNAFYLHNSVQKAIWQDASAAPVNCGSFSCQASAGYRALSDLRFTNCAVTLNGQTLVLNQAGQSYSVTLHGGYLSNGVLDGGEASYLNMDSGAWISYLTMDDMIWQGTVVVAENIVVDNLVNHATVYNYNYGAYTLTVNSKLANRGSIVNHPYGGSLSINLGGDFQDYGAIANAAIYFINSQPVSLFQDANAAAINCPVFHAQGSAGYQALSDLRFTNADVNFNGLTLVLNQAGQSYGITLHGGHLGNAVLDGGEASYLNLDSGAWISYLTMDDMIWQGTVVVAENNVVDRLVNQGTAYNYGYASCTLTVSERLENRGSIINHPYGGQLLIDLAGDFYDYGTLAIYAIHLNNSELSHLFQDAAATPINCAYFQSWSTTSDYQTLSDLRFTNCEVDFNGRTLRLYNGRSSYGLALNGGNLRQVTLDTNGFGFLDFSGNAYVAYVQAGDLILRGTVVCAESFSLDDAVVYGTVYNYGYSIVAMDCAGNFVNYGVIQNHPYGGQLILHCGKDLTNYGSIVPYAVYIDGGQNQYILNRATLSPGSFILVSEIGAALWYFNGNLANPNWLAEIGVNPNQAGVWQPINDLAGRYITIGGGALTLTAPANITAFMANGELKIRWDQVPNAIYYNLYVAATPDGPFTTLLGKVFDTDLVDGYVQTELAGNDPHRFFRVTAGN